MGNDLVSWRAAIGAFYGNTQPMVLGQVYTCRISLSTIFRFGFVCVWLCICYYYKLENIKQKYAISSTVTFYTYTVSW